MIRNLIAAGILLALIGLVELPLENTLYKISLAFRTAPEKLPVPIVGSRPAVLRDSWHAPRTGGRRHEGIDIFAPRGTPVRATIEGVVARVGTSRLGGRVVWVWGPGGQKHYYAHLERFADVFPGQRIETGTVLGYVGNTGNARGTPPHLHYGIYTRTGPINPYPLLHAGSSMIRQRPAELFPDGHA